MFVPETYKDLIINSSKQSVIWGCGPRAQILSFFLNRKFNIKIDYFVDINPARTGKFIALVNHYKNKNLGVITAKTLLKEIKKNEALVIVMNSGYLDEIKEMSENRYEYITLD